MPGYGQLKSSKESFQQDNPINSAYSPRLFGAPPQLTSLCDMRTLSSTGDSNGAVGDFYLENILKNAQVANFSVGRALFTGGFNSVVSIALNLASYVYAYEKYGIYGNSQQDVPSKSVRTEALRQTSINLMESAKQIDATASETTGQPSEEELAAQEQLNTLMGGTTVQQDPVEQTSYTRAEIENTSTVKNTVDEEGNVTEETTEPSLGDTVSLAELEESLGENYQNMELSGVEDTGNFINLSSLSEAVELIEGLTADFGRTVEETAVGLIGHNAGAVCSVGAALLSSLLVSQPFYTFEADWMTYINNVKMMINAAMVMLGLQAAFVRIGNKFMPIGNAATYSGDGDVWTMYRYITPSQKLNSHTSIDNLEGESSQYVSFMIDPAQESESYTNNVGESQIYTNVINKGNDIGTEIAFITNSSQSAVDDAVIQLAGGTVNAAEAVMGALAGGVGKFTAAVASGMAKSFTGDHTIYPEIFKNHVSNTNFNIHVKLRASRGDPYTYLIDVLVPLFHIFGMVLPKMSKNSSAAYQYPPLVQCTVPGIWGTRLGIVESISVTKNPDGDGVSINGYPLSVNVDINVKDLMHVMVTTPMNAPALFLNNNTMFDYIAQCTGVDKYRLNSAARIITKIALAASYSDSFFYNIGEALVSDITSYANKRMTIAGLR